MNSEKLQHNSGSISPHHTLVDCIPRYGGKSSKFDSHSFLAATAGIKFQQLEKFALTSLQFARTNLPLAGESEVIK